MNCSINSRIKSSIPFNHIAIMVRSLDRASAMLSKYDCEIGAQQTWDSEGTAEIYVGSEGAASRLLLIEPIKSGPYARALEKRGPGQTLKGTWKIEFISNLAKPESVVEFDYSVTMSTY